MTQREEIYAEILKCPSTIEQLENILQFKRSNIRGRISEMVKDGDIKRTHDDFFKVVGL